MNAIKYTHPGDKVFLPAQNKPKYILVEIVDTGVGVPEKEQDLISDEFYKGSNV